MVVKGRLSAAGATTFFPFSEAEAGVHLQGSGLRKICDIHVGGYNAGNRRGPTNLCSHASVSGPTAGFIFPAPLPSAPGALIIIKASIFHQPDRVSPWRSAFGAGRKRKAAAVQRPEAIAWLHCLILPCLLKRTAAVACDWGSPPPAVFCAEIFLCCPCRQ